MAMCINMINKRLVLLTYVQSFAFEQVSFKKYCEFTIITYNYSFEKYYQLQISN